MIALFIILTIIGILTTLFAVSICRWKKEPYHKGQDESGEHEFEHEMWYSANGMPTTYDRNEEN